LSSEHPELRLLTARGSLLKTHSDSGVPPYLVLLRVGFAMPATLLPRRCALTAPFHPYPAIVVRSWQGLVILSQRSLRSEGSGRAARRVAYYATQEPRVWLASSMTLPSAHNDGGAVYFLWHFPSSRLEPAVPDVIRHTALRSSDFPPRLSQGDHPVQLPTSSLYCSLTQFPRGCGTP